MQTYKIYPILVGEQIAGDKSAFGYRLDPGVKMSGPFISWLIVGDEDGEPILVDTGGCDEEWAEKYHYKIRRTEDMKIENGLKKLGYSVDDIRTVILTHLHWDHTFGNDLFKNARFYVQKKEVEFGLSPIPTQYISYEAFQMGMTPPWLNSMKQFEVVDGDYTLKEGLELIFLPGHSPGSQGVRVYTEKGYYVLAGDCVQIYECWEKRLHGFPIACGILTDLISYYDSLKKLMVLTNYILPGHDWRVFDHPVYPYGGE